MMEPYDGDFWWVQDGSLCKIIPSTQPENKYIYKSAKIIWANYTKKPIVSTRFLILVICQVWLLFVDVIL